MVWPLPLTGPSKRIRRGSAQAALRPGTHHRQHAQARAAGRAHRGPRCRSAGCRAGNRAGSRRPAARVGWRVTATQATLRRAGAASSLARCGVTWRTDAANTKPMASTSQASAACHGPGVVMPQILMNSALMRCAAGSIARAPRRAACASMALASARRIRRRHQRAADQREVVAAARHARGICGRGDAALGDALHVARAARRPAHRAGPAPL